MATTADFDPKLVDGKYRLTKPLGAGSFGRVYSAIHIETGKVGSNNNTFSYARFQIIYFNPFF